MHLPVANQSLGPAFGRLGSRMACGTFLQSHGLGIAGDIIAGVAGVYIGNWVLKLPFWISPRAPVINAGVRAVGSLARAVHSFDLVSTSWLQSRR